MTKQNKKCLICSADIPKENTFCSLACFHEHQYRKYIDDWKAGKKNGSIGKSWVEESRHVRRYIFEKYGSKCAECGWHEINPYTRTIPLEIEHIDGDATNNAEENLILLCPNCHSLTKTYRGANKGNGARDIKWVSNVNSHNTY